MREYRRGLMLDVVKHVPNSFFNKIDKRYLRSDDVLINQDGVRIGKIDWFHFDPILVASINEYIFLRFDSGQITQEYLYYLLLSDSVRNQVYLQISGSMQLSLNAKFMRIINIDISMYLREQSITVCVLLVVDKANNLTEMFITRLQRIKIELMQDLLTGDRQIILVFENHRYEVEV